MGRYDIPIGAGAMRHRVTLQSKTKVRDQYGQETVTWVSGQGRDALVETIDGQQVQQGNRTVSERTGMITMRYMPGLNSVDHRFLYEGRVLHIVYADDGGGRKQQHRVKWREIVGEDA